MVTTPSTLVRRPAVLTAAVAPLPMQVEQVSGNRIPGLTATSYASPVQVFKPGQRTKPNAERRSIAKAWQYEAYRHVNICGEARYAATLFSALAGRAEIGVSQPNAIARKAVWVSEGPEVDALAELVPTVRDRTKIIRDFMLHRVIAGECYLIARERVQTDPGYIAPPNPEMTWDEWVQNHVTEIDLMDPEDTSEENPNEPIWEIVGVTELRRVGAEWEVRHDNGNYLKLAKNDPVIRMWNPDPENRREAWSPFLSLLPTLCEIEWLTRHIFTQVKSRLMSAGVWFLPENLTFPPPPNDAVEGGAEAIAEMNEAERFMISLASSSMSLMEDDDVSFPSVVMADSLALAQIDQKKLIQFWSTIDDKAMTLRSDAIRRFALGMDLPPEQVIGSSGIAVTGSGGSAGSVNHWGVWANEEQTITAHIEPALDDFVGTLTTAFLRLAVPKTLLIVAYDTATLRLRQDRSKEALEWYDRGILKADVALRETGFDPEHDMMDDVEFKKWLLVKMLGSGSPTPEQSQAILELLGTVLPTVPVLPGAEKPTNAPPGRSQPPSLKDHPYEGPPREQHDHTPAPYSALTASCEVLVLRALEKAGNRMLNEGKRGKDRDRTTPLHLAHTVTDRAKTYIGADFDFGLFDTVIAGQTAPDLTVLRSTLADFCAGLYNSGEPYTREALIEAVGAA